MKVKRIVASLLVLIVAMQLASLSWGAAPQGTRATVIIQFGNGEVYYYTVTLPDSNRTAFKATELACENLSLDFRYTWSSYGGFVTKIGWESNAWPGAYWHFLVWDGMEWILSDKSASSVNMSDGDVVAWIYVEDDSSWNPLNLAAGIPGHFGASLSYRVNGNNSAYYPYEPPGGNVIWTFKGDYVYGFSSTPAVSHGFAFLSDGSYLYALNSQGSLLWKNDKGASYTSSPAVYKDEVMVGTTDGYLRAFHINNGSLIWETKVSNGSVSSSPKVDVLNGVPVVFIGTEESADPWGYLYAIKASSGEVMWRIPLNSSVHFGTPAIYDGKIYVPLAGIFNSSSFLYDPPYGLICVNESDGKVLWSQNFTSSVKYSPVVESSTLYVPVGSEIVSMNPENGSLNWAVDLNATVGNIAAHDGMIFAGTYDSKLYALYSDGSIAWNVTLGGPIQGGPVIVGERLYVADNSASARVYSIDMSGTIVWNYTSNMTGYILSSPVVFDSYLLVATGKRYVIALGNSSALPSAVVNLTVENAIPGNNITISFRHERVWQAILYYRNTTSSGFHTVRMNYSDTSGEYYATIPPQSEGTVVEYYVTVISDNGTSVSSPLQSFTVAPAVPEIAPIALLSVLVVILARRGKL